MNAPDKLEAWGDDVPLRGEGTPQNDGSIQHLIEYLLTVYKRFGNTCVTASLQWGAAAMWKRDELAEQLAQIVEGRGSAEEAPADYSEIGKRNWRIGQLLAKIEALESKPATDALGCMDCGKLYSSFPLDTTLPDDQWRQIHPDEGGILCANCMVGRLAKLPGAIAVRAHLEVTKDRP